jgi:hypothetical protein
MLEIADGISFIVVSLAQEPFICATGQFPFLQRIDLCKSDEIVSDRYWEKYGKDDQDQDQD